MVTMRKTHLRMASRCGGELSMAGATLSMAPAAGGKPPTFEVVAYNGGPVRPESPYLDAPIVIDLASMTSPDVIAAVLDHDDRQIVGQTTRVAIGKSDLRMSGVVTGDPEADENVCPAAKVVKHAARGFQWGASVYGPIGALDYTDEGGSVLVNGRNFQGPIYVARGVRLRNFSFLSDPADQTTRARIAASAAKEFTMSFHDWLKAKGFDDPAALNDAQRTSLEAMFKAETSPPAVPKRIAARQAEPSGDGDGDGEPVAPKPKRSATAKLARAREDAKRREDMEEIAARFSEGASTEVIDQIDEQLQAAASDPTFSVRDFEHQCDRLVTRSQVVDNKQRGGGAQISARVMEASLCLSGGMPEENVVKAFGEQTVEASRKAHRRGLSLREALEMAAAANGVRASFRSNADDVIAAALPPRNLRHLMPIRASFGPSTYDLGDVLGGVINRFVVEYFNGVDMTALNMIAKRRPVSDFRQIESYALTGDMTFELVRPGGNIPHGTIADQKYTNQADTRGKLLVIDRRDLINDDLGVFTQLAQRLGRGGALSLCKAAWTAFMDNSAFFAAGYSNYVTGADTLLSLGGLTITKAAFNALTDPDGEPMNTTARILLVPPELEETAKILINSAQVIAIGLASTSAASLQGNANIHAGTLAVAMARELSNAKYTGYSALAYYVLASPQECPTLELCFLNGVERPTVENVAAGSDTLGIVLRAYFDFGAAKQEPRGGVKSKGAA